MGKMVGADTSFCSVLTYRLQASYFSLSILRKKKDRSRGKHKMFNAMALSNKELTYTN